MAVLAMRKEWITRAHAVGTGSDSAVPIVCDLNLNVFQLLVSPIQKTRASVGLINIIFLNIMYKYFFNHMTIYFVNKLVSELFKNTLPTLPLVSSGVYLHVKITDAWFCNEMS